MQKVNTKRYLIIMGVSIVWFAVFLLSAVQAVNSNNAMSTNIFTGLYGFGSGAFASTIVAWLIDIAYTKSQNKQLILICNYYLQPLITSLDIAAQLFYSFVFNHDFDNETEGDLSLAFEKYRKELADLDAIVNSKEIDEYYNKFSVCVMPNIEKLYNSTLQAVDSELALLVEGLINADNMDKLHGLYADLNHIMQNMDKVRHEKYVQFGEFQEAVFFYSQAFEHAADIPELHFDINKVYRVNPFL